MASCSTRQRTDRYDSTPLYAKDDFVGGLFTEAMNPAERFFSFGLEDKDLAQWGPVKTWLWNFADQVFSSLDPSTSNFYLEATPWLSDMAAFGTGFLGQEEDVGRGGFIDRALPIRESYKGVDASGETNRYHRAFMLNQQQARKNLATRAADERRRAVQVHPRDLREPAISAGRARPARHGLGVVLRLAGQAEFFRRAGYHELPVHEIQWKRRSARPWGTGPGHKALDDMNMLDEMQRSMITAMQFEAEPMWAVHDEDIMSGGRHRAERHRLRRHERPGQAARRADPARRKPASADDGDRADAHADPRGLSFFAVADRQPAADDARRVHGLERGKAPLLAPHLVCIHRGLGGFIGRRAQILMRNGRVPPPPPELQGQSIRVAFVSPFAQVQKAAKARNAIQVGNAAMALQSCSPTSATTSAATT
jgi:hypothetical protein